MAAKRVGVLALLALAAVVAVGCGSSTTTRVSSSVLASAQRITVAAGTAAVTETYLATEPGATAGPPTIMTGTVDFATHSGTFRTAEVGSGGSSEPILLVNGQIYARPPQLAAGLSGLLPGKAWVTTPDPYSVSTTSNRVDGLLDPYGGADPAEVMQTLSSLAVSTTALGPAVVDGTPVTRYSIALASTPARRCSVAQFGAAHPLLLWVDQQGRVRRLQATLTYQSRLPTGADGGVMTVTQTIDDTSFGVPVSVSAPPPAAVETQQQLLQELDKQIAASHGTGSIRTVPGTSSSC